MRVNLEAVRRYVERADLYRRIVACSEIPLNGAGMTLSQFELLLHNVRRGYRRGAFDYTFRELVEGCTDLGVETLPGQPDREVVQGLAAMYLRSSDEELEKLVADKEDEPREFFSTCSEILARPPTRFLLEDFLPEKSFVVLYGDYGTAKSFLSMDWAFCLQTGIEWPVYPTKSIKRSRVLYIALEGNAGLRDRIHAWTHRRGRTPAETFFREQPPWSARDGYAAVGILVERALSKSGFDLIVIDTYQRAAAGGNENDTKDAALFVEAVVARLIRDLGCSVLLLHHTNKGNSMRGSTVIADSADVVMRLDKDPAVDRRSDKRDLFELRFDKAKDGIIPPALKMWLRPVMLPHMSRPSGTLERQFEGSQQRVLLSLSYFDPFTTKQVAERCRMKPNTVLKILDDLEKRGLVEKCLTSRRTGARWRLV